MRFVRDQTRRSIVNEKVGMPEFNVSLDKSNLGRLEPVVSRTPSLPRVAVTVKLLAAAAPGLEEMVNSLLVNEKSFA